MEKNIEFTILYDIYGKLLTDKQQQIFELYYLSDLSLREVAQNLNISYQAVRDSIKTSENMLFNFESKVGMLKLKEKINSIYNECVSKKANVKYNDIISKLNDIK
jgi:predicted DNA-binding protein YlxM (UPF0122 family)